MLKIQNEWHDRRWNMYIFSTIKEILAEEEV